MIINVLISPRVNSSASWLQLDLQQWQLPTSNGQPANSAESDVDATPAKPEQLSASVHPTLIE